MEPQVKKISKANGHIVQSDWNQNDSSQMDYIHNRPVLPDFSDFATKQELKNKQDKLSAGENIAISEDGVISATGGSGAAVVVTKITDTTVELTLDNNTEYRCVNPVESLTINEFSPVTDDVSALWSIIFTAADTITLSLPDSIVWAYADPVFDPSKTYWLSFVPFNNKHLGVWTVADATVSTKEASINEQVTI